MSHPLFYPGITFFYPIGNTSAVRLTEHLPPEQPANVLLLGCGDPRHILYTVYTNATDCDVEHQKLDVTCCDIESAVLARNALLFTLLADDGAQQRLDLIWNVFYHLMLDQESLSLLIEQCGKLVMLAKDLESWKAGPYARFLSVCDENTLTELRRFWGRYVATAEYNEDHRKRFRKSFLDGMKGVEDRFATSLVMTSSRSAGPLLHLAPKAIAEQFRKFWSTGVTDDGLHSVDQATFVNPTFVFSAAGETFSVHYAVDPVAGFHLAEVFATSSSSGQTDAVLAQKVVQGARSQFARWCTAVVGLLGHNSTTSSKLIIRLFAGDGLMLCQAFAHVNSYGVAATPIPISPWKFTRIEFEDQYLASTPTPAPTMFNVIHTSNLSEHVGLLNLLLVTAPILSKSPFATLYTEALLSLGDTSTSILEQLCGDLQTISLLLGIVPSAFLSQFTTLSNAYEGLLQVLDPSATRYYHHFSWKAIDGEFPLSFAPDQLARALFAIYSKMFSDENMARQMQTMAISPTRAIHEGSVPHYTRRSFVQLLSHVKSRVRANWNLVMEKFDDEVSNDSSLILGSNFYQEMCCHFHLLDVVTFTSMEHWYINELRNQKKPAIFRDWETIPPAVTVVLVVPRHKIIAVEADFRKGGTPVLMCEIRNTRLWNMFAYISAAYGKLETTGTGQTKTATIIPDQISDSDSSSLIVFFSVPSSSLILSPNATVGLRTRPTPRMSRTSLFVEAIFTAKLENSRQIHILAEPPRPPNTPPTTTHIRTQTIPETGNVFDVEMDPSCTKIHSFTLRVDVEDVAGQASLAARSPVKIEQASAHGTRLCIDKYTKKICFPLPVDAANTKVRVARKSMYIEVVAPLALSMDMHSERRVANRFITALEGRVPACWNVHRVNVDRCLSIQASDPSTSKWLVPHVSFMFSERERAMRDQKLSTKDTLMNLKDSLHTLLLSAAGVHGNEARSVFGLHDTSTKKFLAFIFVSDLRLDVGSHTVVANAWITPGTMTTQNLLQELEVSNVVAIKLDPDESEAWRYLLPLLIERCRTWTHRPCCEYVSRGTIPLYPEAGADPEKSPFCSCGVGVGTQTFPQHLKTIAPYATRVAIGPLFPVSYLEKSGLAPPTSTSNTVTDPPENNLKCRACGKQAGSRVCGKCKSARYCSRECQLKDWKVHKKHCA